MTSADTQSNPSGSGVFSIANSLVNNKSLEILINLQAFIILKA